MSAEPAETHISVSPWTKLKSINELAHNLINSVYFNFSSN